ncbi:dynein axonemal intermediate chain 4 isoform X2 [Heliangelus exortis]|uniref:dynein axonemal intermediate chain 4 isoform X2 n=1 Tax=Heliangelus exortis TaxID=472823 RepID=UPI003A919703
MQGSAGGRRTPPGRKSSGASSGSHRRASTRGGIPRSRAASCKSQSWSSDSHTAPRGSLVGNKAAPRVFDEEGKDVTPRPLFHPDPDPDSAVPCLFLSRTRGSSSSSTSLSKASATESLPDETQDPGSQGATTAGLAGVQVRQGEMLTEEDLDRRVDIYLTETETLWILDMSPAVVSTESEDAARILERNKIYSEMCEARPGNDRFVENMVQTINGAVKNKEVQCDRLLLEDKGTTVTSWELHDAFNLPDTEHLPEAEGSRAPARMQEEQGCQAEAILTSENFQRDLFFMERVLMENIFQPKLAAYRQLPVLPDPDATSETAGTAAPMKEGEQEAPEEEEQEKEQEDEEEQEEGFVDPPVVADLPKTPEGIAPPRLEELWSYRCDLTHGHSVSSMAWSKVNPDLLAVGYGAFDFKEQKKGLACCWSLKNPRWPERVFQCKHGVTALDFSLASPNLLAVGMFNGSVAIYDVQSCKDTVLLDSSNSLNKHRGPVWQLRWVEQDRGTAGDGKKERLISISADGRVTEWFIQKRLDCTDLVKIKQMGSEQKKLPSEKERKSETWISQQAAGMCFDFHPKDTNLYLAGTEEGHIHKCSSSGTEQFLQTYRGHKAPVYKVAWHPSSTDIFLSCSADWSMMLWHQESQKPLLTFSSTTAFVLDIVWSPKSPFVFAAANESRVEIWDLSLSLFSPSISHSARPQVSFTSVLFATNTDCLLVGDSEGEVGVLELQNLPAPTSNLVDTLQNIIGPLVATEE